MDIINSRDLWRRFQSLKSEKESLQDDIEEKREALEEATAALESAEDNTEEKREALQEALEEMEAAEKELIEWDDDTGEEYESLKSLINDIGEDLARQGVTLVAVDDFAEYAEELASDICDMRDASQWPYRHIDWQAAADELSTDYFKVDYDGTTYLYQPY